MRECVQRSQRAAGAAAQAQVVENHTLVQVRRASHAQKYVAQVEVVGYDCDLAVLNVHDDQFWRGLPALPLPAGLPLTMSEVLTVGFPAGGEELSTSRGVVNRILLGGPMRELCVQIDPGVQVCERQLAWRPPG